MTVTWQDWVLCGVLYVTRMFCITAGYHRYFSHRTYKMGRVPQFLMAFGGTTAVQKGPLWWASHHRIHHRYTDLDGDVHSPREGFWWSHVGWILSTKYKDTDLDGIKDFAAYPELRWLEKYNWIGPWALAIACLLLFGWGGLFIGFFLSTVLLWHGTFLVNSMAHIMGRRRYATPDTSRNSFIIAVITGGEGWHNNHHYLPASVRQGFRWWEIDPTWYLLKGLEAIHVVRDLRNPPARLLDQARVRDGAFDIGMFRSYWERAAKVTGERIADLSARPVPPSSEGAEAAPPTAEAAARIRGGAVGPGRTHHPGTGIGRPTGRGRPGGGRGRRWRRSPTPPTPLPNEPAGRRGRGVGLDRRPRRRPVARRPAHRRRGRRGRRRCTTGASGWCSSPTTPSPTTGQLVGRLGQGGDRGRPDGPRHLGPGGRLAGGAR